MNMEVFFILCMLQSVNGFIKYVNHSIAQNKCKQYGGLASYKDFGKHGIQFTIRDDYAMTLTEGESAWIQGFTNFSTILSWFGCYGIMTQDALNSKNISENNLYTCSQHCVLNANNTEYIALRANECFCLTFSHLGLPYKHTQCEHCINTAYSTLYGATGIASTLKSETNVFKIHNAAKMFWEQGSVKSQQCVFAIIRDEQQRSVSYETDSCVSIAKRGFTCVTSYGLPLNETCNKYYNENGDIPAVCFTSEKISWMEARNQCCEYKGKLIDERFQPVKLYADTNRTYWTGMFRPFSAKNDSTSSCLSATRVNNTLVLDPDDCSKEKRFLCKDNITQIKVTTPSVTTSSVNTESTYQTTTTEASVNTESTNQRTTSAASVNTESTNQPTATAASVNTEGIEQTARKTTMASKHNETNSTKSRYYIYMGIGVSVLFVVVLTIIIIVYKVRKNNIKTEGDAQAFENNSVCRQLDDGIDSKERYVSCVEENRENKTKDICMQDYCFDTADQYSVVNPKLLSEEPEYDKVHLVSKYKGKKTENVDGNIYDHTKDLNEQDHYNALGNIDLKKLQNTADDTYGKLETKESTYDTMAQAKALTTSFDTYAHLS